MNKSLTRNGKNANTTNNNNNNIIINSIINIFEQLKAWRSGTDFNDRYRRS